MNRTLIYAVDIAVCAIVAGGCDPGVGFTFEFPEGGSYYCYTPPRGEHCLPDTTIYFTIDKLELLDCEKWGYSSTHVYVDYGIGTLDGLWNTWGADTVSFFLFDVETVECNAWSKVAEDYMVLQRYDFTKSDLKRLKCTIDYPPTPRMKGIRMYPPYEESQ